jgi:CxxC motif-containing protein
MCPDDSFGDRSLVSPSSPKNSLPIQRPIAGFKEVTEVGKYNIQRGKKFSIEDLLPPKQTVPSTTEGKSVKNSYKCSKILKYQRTYNKLHAIGFRYKTYGDIPVKQITNLRVSTVVYGFHTKSHTDSSCDSKTTITKVRAYSGSSPA